MSKQQFFEEREEEIAEEQLIIQAEREEYERWVSHMKEDNREKRLFSPVKRWKNRKYIRKFDYKEKLPW